MSTKQEWIDYNANIAGQWDLCANCEPGKGGKKLFRQYNFNRTLSGLAVVTSPIDNHEVKTSAITAFNFAAASSPQFAEFGGSTATMTPTWVCAQVGAVMSNPLKRFTAFPNGTHFLAGSPEFEWLLGVWQRYGIPTASGSNLTQIPMCVWSDNGAPGRRFTYACTYTVP